jgi:hypothetical protein
VEGSLIAVSFTRFVIFALMSHLSTLGWKYGWNLNVQNIKKGLRFVGNPYERWW